MSHFEYSQYGGIGGQGGNGVVYIKWGAGNGIFP